MYETFGSDMIVQTLALAALMNPNPAIWVVMPLSEVSPGGRLIRASVAVGVPQTNRQSSSQISHTRRQYVSAPETVPKPVNVGVYDAKDVRTSIVFPAKTSEDGSDIVGFPETPSPAAMDTCLLRQEIFSIFQSITEKMSF